MSGFPQALAYVFGEEGGLADHPDDKGGRTHLGISTPTWELWRDKLGKPGTKVDACTRADAEYIYHKGYWVECKCDALPWPLSLCVFDGAVQHGPESGVKILQRAVGAKDDGSVGAKTLASVAKLHPAKAIRAYIRARLLYYRAIYIRDTRQRTFAPAWTGRVVNLWARCIRDYPEAA